jgi:hypothetical protein
MNFDVLEQGVNDAYDHIDAYVKSKCGGDAKRMDVNRDLYDFEGASGGQVRNFLVSLSTVVVGAYRENARVLGQNDNWKLVYTILYSVIIALVSAGFLAYVYAMYRAYAASNALPANPEAHVVGIVVVLASTAVLCKRLMSSKAMLDKTQYVYLSKVPNTELLWDPSVRHIYYNTVPTDPDERERLVAQDKELSDACAQPEAASNPNAVGSLGNDCGGTLALSRDYVYKNLLPWIQNFYANKARILNALRFQSFDANVQSIRDAHARLLRVLTMDASPDTADPAASQARVDALVDGTILPMLTANVVALPYANAVGSNAGAFTASSSNECIDRAAVGGAALAVFSAASNACTLYAEHSAVVASASNDVAFVLGDKYYGLVDNPRKKATKLSLEPFQQLTDCISACDIDNNCNTCYTSDNRRFTAMRVQDLPAGSALKPSCGNDCYFVQKPNPADLGKTLAARASHLSSQLADLYAQESVIPRDVAERVLLKLAAASSSSSSDALAAAKRILSDAEALHHRAQFDRSYATEAGFVRTLRVMSGEDLLQGVLVPAYVLSRACKTLSPYFLAQSDVATMQWSTRKTAVDASVAIVVLLLVVAVSKAVSSAQDRVRTGFYVLLVVGVAFFGCTLLETWIARQGKYQEARRAAQYSAGNRIVGATSELNDYLRRHSAWVGKLLGLKDVYVDDATGVVYSSGAPLDLRSPVLKRPLEVDALGERAVFASNVRNMAVDIDGLLADCKDVLSLRRVNGFPWNEVSTLVVMIVLLVVLWLYMKQHMVPGYWMERLRNLLRRRRDHDFEGLQADDDPTATYVAIGFVTVVLIVLSALCIRNVQDYQLECRRRRKRP